MINGTKETDFPPGEEGNSSEIGKVVTTSMASSSSTPIITTTNPTPWLRVKDPRIVRVSRVFGGKDRHSKVCTVRGLRDRRVRLSVPTAIQLYDLQDRLGLNQPSKVVDWLIDAAKNEIDELPPLPMLPGNFSRLMPREANVTSTTSTPGNASQSNDHQGLAKNNSDHHGTTVEWDQLGSSSRLGWSNFWSTTSTHTSSDSSTTWRTRSKEVMAREMANEKENLRGGTRNSTSVNDHQGQGKEEGGDIIGNNLLQRTNMISNHHHPFFPGMLNNIANNLANGYRWESPNYPLLMSHLGTGGAIGHGLADHNLQGLNNVVSLQPSTLSLSTGSQYLLCPHGSGSASTNATTTTTTTQTYFPNLLEIHDPRQANHFQMLSSNSAHQNLLPNQMRSLFHFDTSNSPTNDNGNSSAGQSKERE